jgi:potassium-transporting ATPase ATP-binding subunit
MATEWLGDGNKLLPTMKYSKSRNLSLLPTKRLRARLLFNPLILKRAIRDSFIKLHPISMAKNPVMFVVEVGAAFTTAVVLRDLLKGATDLGFTFQIALWLWLTVLFANFAEAMAEWRGKAQADALRETRTETTAKRIVNDRIIEEMPPNRLCKGDVVLCTAGEIIPGDGEVVEGIASVDESAITGESAPVIRESGADRCAVMGGTKVLSDWIKIHVTSAPGDTFLDRMIALVDNAKRQKTPNEIALNIVITGLTLVSLLVMATLYPFAAYSAASAGTGHPPSIAVLISMLVCLIPTTVGGLLSAIGIAGMARVMQHNVLAMSAKAVEAAGDVNTLLLDKTGTLTMGNRQAVEFIPVDGVSEAELADAAQLSSLADETPEGRSIVVLAKNKYSIRGREVSAHDARFIAFSPYSRMSGVDLDHRSICKGAVDRVIEFVKSRGGTIPPDLSEIANRIARVGGTPLAVADGKKALGVIHLKDIVKGGMRERFDQLRAMGIRSFMITGDNPLTAAAIAEEAGVDDFLAQATPKGKMDLICQEQAKGRLVAMAGDGTDDAPALAQSDVGMAMNTGTIAAKEAGNMVDLDSNPTKLIEVVAIGKQLVMTRGVLTIFSIASDFAMYFAVLPAMLMKAYPELSKLNIMNLHSPESAILAAVIFNALIILALIPLALSGVSYKPVGAAALLRRNLLVYGLGGIIAPFLAIWLLDRILGILHLA